MALFQVIAPKDPGFLWEALKSSKLVEKALETDEHHSDTKYVRALTDAYEHASSWDTRRQVLCHCRFSTVSRNTTAHTR